MKKLIVTTLMALLTVGCAATQHHKLYEGDAAQKAQILSYETVMIKYVDDTKMGVSFIGQQHEYDVKAGQHVLLVEYSDIFDVGSDDHEKVVSRPAKITFTAEPGKQYQVQHSSQKRLDHAKAFAEKPAFWMVELPGGERINAVVELSRPRTFMSKLNLGAPEYEFESDSVTAGAAMTATTVESAVSATTVASANDKESASGNDLSNLKMLQYTWMHASEQERADFLQWIKTQ